MLRPGQPRSSRPGSVHPTHASPALVSVVRRSRSHRAREAPLASLANPQRGRGRWRRTWPRERNSGAAGYPRRARRPSRGAALRGVLCRRSLVPVSEPYCSGWCLDVISLLRELRHFRRLSSDGLESLSICLDCRLRSGGHVTVQHLGAGLLRATMGDRNRYTRRSPPRPTPSLFSAAVPRCMPPGCWERLPCPDITMADTPTAPVILALPGVRAGPPGTCDRIARHMRARPRPSGRCCC